MISRESVEKEGEEAGLPGKLTKPTLCEVSPIPLLRILPCRAPAPPRRFCCDSGSLSRGWGASEEQSRAVLRSITCRGGGYKILEPGRRAGDLRTSPLQGPLCSQSRRRHLGVPKGLTACVRAAPGARALDRRGEGAPTTGRALQPPTPPDMSRSFYVDSLIIKDSSRPAPSLPEPHPGPDFFIPLGVPAPLVISVPGPGCASRKSGAFCVCPLCVTSHLHSSRGPASSGGGNAGAGSAGATGGGGAGAAGALPLLKSQFSSGPGDAQFCPRVSHAHHHHHPPQHHHHQPQQPGSAAAAAAAALGHPQHHAPVCTATTYNVADPRRFHCLTMGRAGPGHLRATPRRLPGAKRRAFSGGSGSLWGGRGGRRRGF